MDHYTRRQKIILTIYALLSLPLLPLMAIVYPFSKWAVYGGKPKLDLVEFLCMSMAMATLTYIVAGLLYWLPPNTR